MQDSNVSYGIEGLGMVSPFHRCGSIYSAYIQKYDKATIYNERMLIKKNNEKERKMLKFPNCVDKVFKAHQRNEL